MNIDIPPNRRSKTHGHTRRGYQSPTYQSWASMIKRCTNSKRKEFKYYGGRGIKVCDSWLIFENFLADMGVRPDNTTLDRYPNKDGNYELDNCRWATMAEQTANKNRRNSLTHPEVLSHEY